MSRGIYVFILIVKLYIIQLNSNIYLVQDLDIHDHNRWSNIFDCRNTNRHWNIYLHNVLLYQEVTLDIHLVSLK